jgi:hypothetical protein
MAILPPKTVPSYLPMKRDKNVIVIVLSIGEIKQFVSMLWPITFLLFFFACF